jgi:hypothetical protein
LVAAPAYAQKDLHMKPSDVLGYKACTECHKNEVDAWRKTTHFKTFAELEGRDEANDILDKLELDSAKDSTCISCHFTMKGAGQGKAISGISCESCHGAAKNWLDKHNKKGVPRAQRVADSIAGGMIPPSRIYDVGTNCFDCHVVDDAELVEVGRHPAFSEDFDLFSWSQGEVRHSFMTPGDPVKLSGKQNRAADANHKRKLFMVGKLLSLEYSLRALAKSPATPQGDKSYAKKHYTHFVAVRTEVGALNQLAPTDEVTKIVDLANNVTGKTMGSTAKAIAAESRKFASAHDGSKLGALDSKIPNRLRGSVHAP